MLHILLVVLKIIGMILLVIIGLILLICACILFVPIRYRAQIKQNGDTDIRVRVTYLLHIISVCAGYKDKGIIKELKLFGIKTHFLDAKPKKKQGRRGKSAANRTQTKEDTYGQDWFEDASLEQEDLFDEIDVKRDNSFINRSKRKIKRRLHEQKRNKERKKQGLMEEEDEYLGIYETERDLRDLDNVQVIEDNFFEGFEGRGKGTKNGIESETDSRQTDGHDIREGENAEDSGDKNVFATIKSKIIQIIRKIKYHFGKICGTIRKVLEGIKKARSNVNNILDIINDDINREAFTFVKGEAFKVIGHVKPRQVKGYVRFGFDDPYNTGRLLGIIYAVLRGVNKNLEIRPDFDNKVLEADVIIKGRIQLYYLLIIAYRIYKNESFKKAFERRRKNGR